MPQSNTPTTPPRVDYALTDLGQSLIEPLTKLSDWAVAKRKAIEEARVAFDRRVEEMSA